jgi:hypothetical protein
MPLYELADATMPVYVDAMLLDTHRQFLVLSLWSQETEALSILGRMTLPSHEDGLSELNLVDCNDRSKRMCVGVTNHKLLKKFVNKTPANTAFGSLCHMIIYNTQVLSGGDRASGRTYVIQSDGTNWDFDERVWAAINRVCQIPLLESWRDIVMAKITDAGWIKNLDGFGLTGVQIDLAPDDMEAFISSALRTGVLSCPITQGGKTALASSALKRGQLDLLI